MSVINCPHCGKEVFKGTNGAWLFGSPIQTCKACGGQRLKKSALAVTVDNRNIYEMTTLSIGELQEELTGLEAQLEHKEERWMYLTELKEKIEAQGK